MRKLNNKGFTLVEVLAVIVILGVLATITVPAVSTVIEQNKENSYENLQKSIIAAAKIYISDNKYEITLGGSCGTERPIQQISGTSITNSQIPIQLLVESGDLNDGNGTIIYPKDKNLVLVLDSSYVIVKYDCSTKKYKYPKPGEIYLEWENREN